MHSHVCDVTNSLNLRLWCPQIASPSLAPLVEEPIKRVIINAYFLISGEVDDEDGSSSSGLSSGIASHLIVWQVPYMRKKKMKA